MHNLIHTAVLAQKVVRHDTLKHRLLLQSNRFTASMQSRRAVGGNKLVQCTPEELE